VNTAGRQILQATGVGIDPFGTEPRLMSEIYDQSDFAERQTQALWWQAIAVAIVATLALAPWDVAISQAVYASHPSGLIGGLLKFVEKLGNGVGVIAIVIVFAVFDRRVWSRWPQLLAASLGAGLIADCVKLCVDRGRPYSLDLATATFTSTFHGWLSLLPNPAGEQSFPSGHATTAAGLAVALAFLYPRGRWLFGLVAAAVMAQRVVVHAHFPTDVMVGAIIGIVWARQCNRGAIGAMFYSIRQRIERAIGTQQPSADPLGGWVRGAAPPPGARRGWRSLDSQPQSTAEITDSTPRRRSA
jgi:membrane-associated phospholipid phosphatase